MSKMCNALKLNIKVIVAVVAILMLQAHARRRYRSMLKLEELETSKDFLMKFINDSPVHSHRQFCRGKFIKQVISHPGCISKPIINKMCYGMCKSAYVPEVKDNKAKSKTCVQCQPASLLWMTVSLQCPMQRRKVVFKKVRKVRKCHCWSNNMQMPMMMIPDSKSVLKVMSWLKSFK
eukprot:gene17642-19397_t